MQFIGIKDSDTLIAADLAESDEAQLRGLAEAGLGKLRKFPDRIEGAFRLHFRTNIANLLRQSIYLLVAIYLLVCLPISLLSEDPALRLWQALAMAPIGGVLLFIWLISRFSQMDAHVETALGICLCISLLGTIFCSMLLGDSYFGHISSYETIYVLIIAFTILRLPTPLAVGSSVLAFALALGITLARGTRPAWFDMLLYFGVPLIICTVNGYMLEFAERRNFMQNLLINLESQRLAKMRQQAEHAADMQEKNARFLEMIAGNLSATEIASRALSFFITETGALVGAAYGLEAGGQLTLLAQWGADVSRLRNRQKLETGQTLLGPVLRSRQVMQVTRVAPDYLPIGTGSGQFRPAALLLVPVFQGSTVSGAIELGALHEFTPSNLELIRTVTTHLAYAMQVASSRSSVPQEERETGFALSR